MSAPAAARSSFYAGMRVLPRDRRHAMYAIYAFARAVDDIADDVRGDRATRMRALDGWRADIAALYAGGDPRRAAILAETVARYAPARVDFDAVIDGMAMDVAADLRWPRETLLDLYCDRVASAVGRLSVCVFGMETAPGIALSHHLGRALQLTNILRDVDEDAAIGRVYLPIEALEAAEVPIGSVAALVAAPQLDAACRIVAAKAHAHFVEADRILAARPAGHLIAPRLMAAAYASLLARMTAVGWAPPRRRVRHNRIALAWRLARLRLGA